MNQMNYDKKVVKKKRSKMGKRIIIIRKTSSIRKISTCIELSFTHIQLTTPKLSQISNNVQVSCITIKFYIQKISSKMMMMAIAPPQAMEMLMVGLIIKN